MWESPLHFDIVPWIAIASSNKQIIRPTPLYYAITPIVASYIESAVQNSCIMPAQKCRTAGCRNWAVSGKIIAVLVCPVPGSQELLINPPADGCRRPVFQAMFAELARFLNSEK